MRQVIFYTDCDSFAGCENMIAVLMNSHHFAQYFNTKLIFRDSKMYRAGVKNRITNTNNCFPLKLSVLRRANIPQFLQNIIFVRIFLRLTIIILFPITFLINFFLVYLRLQKEIKDIIIINNGGYPGAVTCLQCAVIAKIIGFKEIYMIVNNAAERRRAVWLSLDKIFDQFVISSVDTFISGSKSASDALNFNRCIPSEKLLTLANGIDIRRFDFNHINSRRCKKYKRGDKVVFTIIGLHERRKGHIVLLQAVKILLERRSDLFAKIYVIVEGVGNLTNSLRQFVSVNNLNEIIEFKTDVEKISELYEKTDVLVHPSLFSEDLPNVISEALMFGIPVLGSRLAGIPSQITPELNGFLFDVGNALELSKTMERLLDSTENLNLLSANSVEVFKKYFSADVSVEKYLALLNKEDQDD